LEEVNRERYLEILELTPLISQFSLYSKAKGLGIEFGPKDLETDKVILFSIIKDSLEKEFERRRDATK